MGKPRQFDIGGVFSISLQIKNIMFMWGFYHRQFLVKGKPYWLYQLSGNNDSLNEILSSQLGVSKDNNGLYYYRLKKFHGPAIEVIKKSSSSNTMYIPVYCGSASLPLEEMYLDLDYSLGSRVKEWRTVKKFYERNGNYSEFEHVNIISEELSVSDRLEVIFNSFINFHSQAQFVILCFELNGKKIKVNAKSILDYILYNQAIGNDTVDISNFLGIEQKVLLWSSIEDEEFELYPYNKKNISCVVEDEKNTNLNLNGVCVPDYLYRYIEWEYETFLAHLGSMHEGIDDYGEINWDY